VSVSAILQAVPVSRFAGFPSTRHRLPCRSPGEASEVSVTHPPSASSHPPKGV
jgi:hypothetical protein